MVMIIGKQIAKAKATMLTMIAIIIMIATTMVANATMATIANATMATIVGCYLSKSLSW